MKPVVVVGGYGRLGSRCVKELLNAIPNPILIAGPSVQKAETAAATLGPRVQGIYLDAGDARTLRGMPEVEAWLICCPGLPLALLEHAIEVRTPAVAMTPMPLAAPMLEALSERSWENETPLVLFAGWAPGLASVLAEQLARTHEALDEIRVATTGPWLGSQAAMEDWNKLSQEWRHGRTPSSHRRMLQFGFPDPVGARRVVAVPNADLEAFASQHTIAHVSYYEQDRGFLARGYRRLTRREESSRAVLVAEAFTSAAAREPAVRLTLLGADPLQISAWIAVAVLNRLALGKLAAGVSTLREALNPGQLLRELSDAGASLVLEHLGKD